MEKLKKILLRIFIGLLVFCAFCMALALCSTCNDKKSQGTNTETVSSSSNGLIDLNALTEIVRNSSNSQEVEEKVNEPNGINNIDVDKDGEVDYLKVDESSDNGVYKYTFTALGKDSEVEVANIEIDQTNNQANTYGNPHYYGNNNYVQTDLSDFLILSYLLSHHSYYSSPYHYGYYPHNYTSYRTVPRSQYYGRSTVKSASSNSSRYTHSTTKTDAVQKRSLSGQKSFQKGFKTRNTDKAVNTSGFKTRSTGTSASNTSSSRPSYSSNSGSSSSSSYSRPSRSSFSSSSSSSFSRSSGSSRSSSRRR